MLDAFGKGASADIQAGKAELYARMTWDPSTNTSWAKDPQARGACGGVAAAAVRVGGRLWRCVAAAAVARACAGGGGARGVRRAAARPGRSSQRCRAPRRPRRPPRLRLFCSVPAASPRGPLPEQTVTPMISPPLSPKLYWPLDEGNGYVSGGGGGGGGPSPAAPRTSSRLGGSTSSLVSIVSGQGLLPGASGCFTNLEGPEDSHGSGISGPSPSASPAAAGAAAPAEGGPAVPGRPSISPMPPHPLDLLRKLHELIKARPSVSIEQFLNVLVDQLRQKCLEEARSSAARQLGAPPGLGGRPVPDIYDAAKYDAIHNAHLGLELEPVYQVAKQLADAVIPNEYGVVPTAKLRIGSMICSQLLGKLLADLASMREESLQTGVSKLSVDEEPAAPAGDGDAPVGAEPSGDEVVAGGEPEDEGEDRPLHRLCPSYATDINSPFRHVRTRIYFTSESHMHSLVNVLRFCHLDADPSNAIIGEAGQRVLRETTELDYMTHLVLRMFENKSLPLHDPGRFRVELLFSPGAAYEPFECAAAAAAHDTHDHVLPVAPRTPIHSGDAGAVGVPWAQLEGMLMPFAKAFKRPAGENPYPALPAGLGGAGAGGGNGARVGVNTALNSQTSEPDYYLAVT
eukprot:scaffold4.g4707.t1